MFRLSRTEAQTSSFDEDKICCSPAFGQPDMQMNSELTRPEKSLHVGAENPA
jgi:hypothetical protein